MRITKLRLRNFAHIYSGLGKREVRLEFTEENSKLINVIIGKMGSCKTVILGHLQPFASFGTLDIRNQDGIIMPGEDGLKNIVFQHGDVKYDITHYYSWNKKTGGHSVKSYIEKNGEELNENGNVRSFAAIIKDEFGLDQNQLRLFRLGSNVINVIDLKSTDRKTFVSTLTEDTNVYEMLYKKLKDELRQLNAQISLLSNKANSLSNESLDKLQERLSDLEDTISGVSYRIESTQKDIYLIEAESSNILSGYDSLDSYVAKYESLDLVIKKESKRHQELKKEFNKMISLPSENEVVKSIGINEGKLASIEESLATLGKQHKEVTDELVILEDRRKTYASDIQLKMLRANYEQAIATYNEYKEHAAFINIDITPNQLRTFLSDLDSFQRKLTELQIANAQIVSMIAGSDDSVLTSAKTAMSKLNAQRMKLQKDLNNIGFSASYHCNEFLVIPYNCPMPKTCPYVVTHPMTLGVTSNAKELAKKRNDLNDQITAIDAKIDTLNEYPLIHSKIATIRKMWWDIKPLMESLGILIIYDINKIITSHTEWYNQNLLGEVIEAVEKKSKLSEMADSIVKMKETLDQNSVIQIDELDAKITELASKRDEITRSVMQANKDKIALHGEINKLKEVHRKILDKNRVQSEMEELLASNQNNSTEFNRLSTNIDTIYNNKKMLDSLKPRLQTEMAELARLNKSRDQLNILINEIKTTNMELDSLVMEQMYLRHIVAAVSPSEGIPLVYVERFLESCREIMNDLISDVFSDQIVIQRFVINEDEFRIPYTMNGTLISDISFCSQGQKAIVALALAFAMIREAIDGGNSSFIYNIMCLDEVDGALYKSSRNDFIDILFKQLKAIDAEQAFLISHNNTFDGYDVNIIMTTDEMVDDDPLISVMRV